MAATKMHVLLAALLCMLAIACMAPSVAARQLDLDLDLEAETAELDGSIDSALLELEAESAADMEMEMEMEADPAPAAMPTIALPAAPLVAPAVVAAPVATSPTQGAWIGAGSTAAPAVPAPKPVVEPANAPITPSSIAAVSTANNAVTSVAPVPAAAAAESRFDPAARPRRDQPRKVVGTAGAGEVSVKSYTETFTFVQSQSSEDYTIATLPALSIEALAEACFKDVRCTGFTSIGELKSFIRPASKWVTITIAGTNSVNTDMATAGLYYQPQWYRFQPAVCPCDADVPLNFICSDPNSGDQYLGEALTDRSCYRAKPATVLHTCSAKTCATVGWVFKQWDACPSCGLNVTVTRKVTCESKEGTVHPSKVCKYLSAKPATSKICSAAVACEWTAKEGECKAVCGGGYLEVDVKCSSPADRTQAVADRFCTGAKPRTRKRCRSKDCVWNTVPDGHCSFSCGDGHRQLKATCIEPGKPDVALPDVQCANVRKPAVLVPCNNRACQWESKATSPCSQPCGRGQQSVRNTCRDPLTGTAMPAAQCSATKEPPASFQPCSIQSCVWETRPVGACSNSCGAGVQKFDVSCRDPTTNHRVEDAQCGTAKPEAASAPCENNACGWRVRPIGQCSAACGEGVQKFNVTCEDPITGALLDEKMCGSQKPSESSSCRVRECHWHRATAGGCSAKCGPGIQAYKLSCVNPADGSRQKKAQCVHLVTPPLSEPCQLHACEWRAKNKGGCSQICGPGRQDRTVACHDPVSGDRVPSEHCTGKAPSTNTKCYAQSCIWSTKPTTACSASCGPGTQSVNVTCTDPNRRFVLPDSQCYDKSRPTPTQSCNLQECAWTTSPAAACSSSCGKGTQKLTVSCKDPRTGVAQKDGQCDAAAKPAAATSCFVKPCTWISDTPALKCSQICGPGHVLANVTCQDAQTGTVYPESLCPSDTKPPAMQPCQIESCIWATEWSACNKTCGGDFQYTKLTCTAKDGTVVSNAQCAAAPPAWRQCATEACRDVKEAFLLYSFDEDVSVEGAKVPNRVADAAKIGLHGLVTGAGAISVGGRGGKGQAAQLPASGDHTSGPSIVIPAHAKLTSKSFSVSFWLQILSTPTSGRFYILLDNRGTLGGGEGFVVYLDPRDGMLYLNDAYSPKLGKSHFADSGSPFPQDGLLHHVALTYDGQVVKFSFDGKQTSLVDGAHTFEFTVPTSEHSVHLRGSPDKYWRYLPVTIDEFAYFDYPLTQAQIKVLADATVTNTCAAGFQLTAGGCSKYRLAGDALDERCAASTSFDAQKCLQPLWGLNGCSNLGTSFPVGASDAALWSQQSWSQVKANAAAIAVRDVEPQLRAKKLWGACQNRTPSGLDLLCDHPPPFHTAVCLQALFLESGCSRRAQGFPASASHPLAAQLNQLSWRDVKAKIKNIIDTDVSGGASEGLCHDKTFDDHTQ